MLIPERPSLTRKILLAPAAVLYAAGSWLHRFVWLRLQVEFHHEHKASLPVIVIGSLRAGGAGKTPVVREVARHLSAQGFRVGVLAYTVGVSKHSKSGREGQDAREVFPDSDWRESSDEAVMLARDLAASGVRIFATRDRAHARRVLAYTGEFDVLVSDDGLMDPRLTESARTLRVVLVRQGEYPGWMDLLPAGPYRLTAVALQRIDCVLREGEDFHRALVPPEYGSPDTPAWLLAGLGNPEHFRRALVNHGFRIVGGSYGPDHGVPNLARAAKAARAAGAIRFLCTAKDWVKLEGDPHRPEPIVRIAETVTLSDGFLARATTFSRPPTS